MALSLPRILSLLILLLAALTAVHAHGVTNGERLARGLPLAKPRRLFEPTRVQHARRSNVPPSVQSGVIGVSPVVIDDRKRSPAAAAHELAVRDPTESVTVYPFYVAPESGNTASAPGITTTTQASAVMITYHVASPGILTNFLNNGLYIGTCCSSSHCWIDDTNGSYLTLVWTYVSSPAGAYPGGTPAPLNQENCAALESTMYTVDENSGLITVQYINPVSATKYPSGYTIPPQYLDTYVVLNNGVFYLTANVAATIALLGGGSEVALYVTPQ